MFYAVNGSPRKNGNTAHILECVLEGVRLEGVPAEMVHLSDYEYSGCRSCFACKLKNGASYGKCAWNDNLTPVLEKLRNSDGIVFGTPVYFGGESGYMRNLIERLAFPALRYDATFSSVAEKHFPVAFVYTMNRPLGQLDSLGYPEKLGIVRNSVGHLLGCGEPEALYVCDTWQFDDYEKYDACGVDVLQKQATRASQFPRDCQAARELGMRLAKALKPGK